MTAERVERGKETPFQLGNLAKMKQHAEKLKARGSLCCSRCGLPSGMPEISLRKINGKYVCTLCLSGK